MSQILKFKVISLCGINICFCVSTIILDALLFCALGFFGVNIYLSTAEKEITRLKNINFQLDEKSLLDLISKKGGTSNLYAFILYCALVVLYFLILIL